MSSFADAIPCRVVKASITWTTLVVTAAAELTILSVAGFLYSDAFWFAAGKWPSGWLLTCILGLLCGFYLASVLGACWLSMADREEGETRKRTVARLAGYGAFVTFANLLLSVAARFLAAVVFGALF